MTTKKTGRPRKGSLEFRGKTWHARLTVTVDGENIRRWVNLETDNKAVARRKVARIVAQNAAPSVEALVAEAKRAETYAELADRVHKAREADGIGDAAGERKRELTHILPEIGPREVASIGFEDIEAIFQLMAESGKSAGTIRHVRQVLLSRFAVALREKVITESPLEHAVMPRAKVDNRERAVLTDAELAVYLAWQHPTEDYRLAVLQRQTMACISRMFGGLRTGDLHALRWESLDAAGGFRFGWAPRKKTKRPQKLDIPEMLRPFLVDWWQYQGSPLSGLVFPVLRGDEAGKGAKGHVTHAEAFRRDLKRAFGLETLQVVVTERKNRRKLTRECWLPAPGREMTAREREIFGETEYTRPVDFHSWRRAYVQALADAEVNAQQAAALAGHTSLATHGRYLPNTAKARELPAAALPALLVTRTPGNDFAPDLGETPKLAAGAEHQNQAFSASESVGVRRFELPTSGTQTRRGYILRAVFGSSVDSEPRGFRYEIQRATRAGQKSRPKVWRRVPDPRFVLPVGSSVTVRRLGVAS
jgi:hypothetical protein